MSSKKFPSHSQWKQIFKVLKGPEKILFLCFIVLFFLSAIYLAVDLYIDNTKLAPAYGGTYAEGIVGQPRFVNPVYGETNDVDRTLIGLIYSGLMTYDKEGGLVGDLVKNYQISDDGKIYTFELKGGLFWQDGAPLTVDDVIYTIETIQNSDYKSPLRASWLNVGSQKLSDKSFALYLNSPYNSFLENCTVKIIPKHIWKNVLPENFALSSYNLEPVGSGPYRIAGVEQNSNGFIRGLKLASSPRYYGKKPYIANLSFKFFSNKDELIKAANQKTINGFAVSSLDDNAAMAEKQVRQGWSPSERFAVYSFPMPRYFAVFFNAQEYKIFSDGNITQALSYSINKQEVAQKLKDAFKEKISIVDSPILPGYFGFPGPTITYDFNLDRAAELLDKSGFKDSGSGAQGAPREKANNKKPAFQFKNYLSLGSKGDEVTELQGCLARLDNNLKDLLQNETSGKYGKGTGEAVTAFQKKYLADLPSTGEVGANTRKKLNELCLAPQNNSTPLQFTLTTLNQPQLVMAANLLRDFWQKVGASVQIKTAELSALKDIIKNRSYDALLYGQALGSLPDLYPFWYSTQINDPGLNLSGYQNKKADQSLKTIRETLDSEIKIREYGNLQDIILADAPALFLYSTNYLYWVSENIKGFETTKIVDPAKRFSNIRNWYINTKRAWK